MPPHFDPKDRRQSSIHVQLIQRRGDASQIVRLAKLARIRIEICVLNAPSALNQVNNKHNDRNDEQEMDQTAANVTK